MCLTTWILSSDKKVVILLNVCKRYNLMRNTSLKSTFEKTSQLGVDLFALLSSLTNSPQPNTENGLTTLNLRNVKTSRQVNAGFAAFCHGQVTETGGR